MIAGTSHRSAVHPQRRGVIMSVECRFGLGADMEPVIASAWGLGDAAAPVGRCDRYPIPRSVVSVEACSFRFWKVKDILCPELRVWSGPGGLAPVLRAPVPEAAVDKDRDTSTWQREVRSALR
jgi:hypothetical protein